MKNQDNVTLEFPDKNPGQRLRELILYVADRLEDDKDFGRVKLAKILYFADFTSYRLYREPITGSAYIRWDYGPVPERFLAILEEMEASRLIAVKEQPIIDHTQKRVIALRPADVSLFSGRDIQIVEDVIRRFEGKTGRDLSQMSHGMAWRLTAPNERIPYEASILSDEPLTEADIERARELAREYGLG